MLNIPEGMITIDEFTNRNGLQEKEVIDKLHEGIFVGEKIGDQWFVDPSKKNEIIHHKISTDPRPVSSIILPVILIGFSVLNFISVKIYSDFAPSILVAITAMTGVCHLVSALLLMCRKESGRVIYGVVMPMLIISGMVGTSNPIGLVAFIGYGFIMFFLYRPKISNWLTSE